MKTLPNLLVIQVGKLRGPFQDFRSLTTRFVFANSRVWLQNESNYHYAHASRARVTYVNNVYILEIHGMEDTVQVTEVLPQFIKWL